MVCELHTYYKTPIMHQVHVSGEHMSVTAMLGHLSLSCWLLFPQTESITLKHQR